MQKVCHKIAAPSEGAAGGEECLRTNANEVQVRAIYNLVVKGGIYALLNVPINSNCLVNSNFIWRNRRECYTILSEKSATRRPKS